jgi:hypothetical protein
MGAMQRTKGATFERKIASILRLRWPNATVHRSSQADRAYDSDVVIDGGPEWTRNLWLELQDARHPNPRAKLAQAERDVGHRPRCPIVIWHKLSERTIWVTLRWETMLLLINIGMSDPQLSHPVVTLELSDFLAVVESAQE